jgi:hypothetical protein
MSEVATKEELDGLVKTVKDATDALKNAHAADKENIKTLVEETIKSVLASDPRVTQSRKVLFADNAPTEMDEVMESAPEEAKKALDNCFILSKVLGKPVQHLKSWRKFGTKFADFKKALDTSASGGGTEWIPTDFTGRLWELVRVQGSVVPLFPMIQMPTQVYTPPIQLGRVVSYMHNEQTADTGQTKMPVGDGNTLSGKITLTSKGHSARVLTSKEQEEDSIVPILPWLQQQVVMALAEGREDAIINGDTAGSQDSDDTNAAGHNRMWNGLRYLALNNSLSYDLATLTLSNIRANLRANMLKYGVLPQNLALICDLRTYIKLVDLDAVTTMEKFGPMATVLRGQLGVLDGIPVIVSEWARSGLNASGVYDGVTTTKGSLLLVYRNGYVFGERRTATVQVLRELYAESDQDAVITKERVAFSPTHPIASNPTVTIGYNIG